MFKHRGKGTSAICLYNSVLLILRTSCSGTPGLPTMKGSRSNPKKTTWVATLRSRRRTKKKKKKRQRWARAGIGGLRRRTRTKRARKEKWTRMIVMKSLKEINSRTLRLQIWVTSKTPTVAGSRRAILMFTESNSRAGRGNGHCPRSIKGAALLELFFFLTFISSNSISVMSYGTHTFFHMMIIVTRINSTNMIIQRLLTFCLLLEWKTSYLLSSVQNKLFWSL